MKTPLVVIFILLAASLPAWEKYEGNPVLEPVSPWAWMALGDPAITCISGGGCLVVYTAAGLDTLHGETLTRPGAAWSSDGFDWTMSDGPVITNGFPGTWDSAAVETPTVLFDGDSLILMYAGEREHGGGQLAFGIASSHDGGESFTRLTDGPVFTRDTTRPEEYRSIDSPTLIRMGDSLVIWYTAQSLEWYLTVCRASSFDGITWHRYPGNPVMDVGAPGEFDEMGPYAPCVRQMGDSLVMIYQGFMLGDTSYMFDSTFLGWATSGDGGLTWRRAPENPVLGPGPPGSWDENGPKTPSFTRFGDGILGIYWNAIDGRLGLFTHSFLDISEKNNKPTDFAISAYPNPFNSAVTITAPAGAEIEIYDVNGRMVDGGTVGANLVFAHSTGDHKDRPYECVWRPAPSLTSGVYLVRAKFSQQTASAAFTKRIVYLK